jgi:hypothetical protein
MPTIRALLALSLSLLLLIASPVQADPQHIVAPAQLAATVTERVAQQDADRGSIAEALARPEVRRAAEAMGVEMSRVEAAARTLAGADLERAAHAARDVNDDLVGGASSVTIGTTTLIIILLLLILIIVAVK